MFPHLGGGNTSLCFTLILFFSESLEEGCVLKRIRVRTERVCVLVALQSVLLEADGNKCCSQVSLTGLSLSPVPTVSVSPQHKSVSDPCHLYSVLTLEPVTTNQLINISSGVDCNVITVKCLMMLADCQ